MSLSTFDSYRIADRFRGFLPIVVDIETGGFNADTDAMLEIAAVIIKMDNEGMLYRDKTYACHVKPFEGANLEQAALSFNGIDPFHPFRMDVPENEALETLFEPIREEIKQTQCSRAILVGHNPAFDIGFLKAAVERTQVKSPFHSFSTFDTATLGGLIYGQTVLAKAADAAGMDWDHGSAHSAAYDAEQTADLFCTMVNTWHSLNARADDQAN